jgi:2,5-diamino-6-(ribosylamino)-4(3H)-pyrimidinone 5'-phosphate reductase
MSTPSNTSLSRPYIFCHMMTTIEGRITSGIEGISIFDEYYPFYSQLEHEFKSQAWMCGRVTSEEFAEGVGTPLQKSDKKINARDFRSSSKGTGFMIAIDTKGLLRWKSNVLTFGDQSEHHIIVIVNGNTPKEYLSYLQEKDISYIFGGKERINFTEVFEKLKSNFQIEILALEGGGILNGSVLESGLIDEISLLITPQVLNNSNVPTMFEKTPDEELNIHKYTLFEVKKLEKDCIWLRYKKKDE